MGKQKKTLEEDMDKVFEHWAVGPEARKNLELYQPDKEEDNKTSEQEEPKSEGQKPSAKDRYSKPSAQERTFKDRLDAPEDGEFSPIDIPAEDFFSYYGTLFDVVIPQLHPYSRLILSVLFHQSYGSGRNWCQMSSAEMIRMTGLSRNSVRTYLRALVKDRWVCIVSDGYHEATTYGVRIPITIGER